MNIEQLANLLQQTWSQGRSARFTRPSQAGGRPRPKEVWDRL